MGETCGSNKGGFDLEECGVSPVFDVSTSGDRAAAIEAATHPADGDALYFVAVGDGSGAHVFSPSLDQHNAAVARYLQQLRQQRTKETPAQ